MASRKATPRPLLAKMLPEICGAVSIGAGWRATARAAGRCSPPPNGLPAGLIRGIYLDHASRLWIATGDGGAARIDDPQAEHPRFTVYNTANGLSSNQATAITEDRWGRIYIGTGRGVDRLDPTTGHIKHYTTADGLASNFVNVALRDREGALWFGTLQGLSKLTPEPDRPALPPPTLISALRVAGVSYPISDLGAAAVAGLELGSPNPIQIDFVGLSLGVGEAIRYQYKLESADSDWSAPTEQRTVNYPNLESGSYRFLVRAVTADGTLSDAPATVSFRILPPIWRRGWFVTIAVILIGLTVYAADRYRVARLLELERVRTRIATDLHDDIGASLSRVAVLSEVVKRQTEVDHQESADMLSEIADSARGLVDSMSDIVWSIDPRKDDLKNVVSRIRQFASDVLEARAIDLEFRVPEEMADVKLGPEQRRHLFLILKEAVNNAARHSQCGSVSFDISLSNDRLVAEIRDDGRGFNLEAAERAPLIGRGGNGLGNMQARAAEIGGRLNIVSSPGAGTRLTLVVPLRA